MRQSAEGGLAIDASGRAIGMTVFGPRRRVLVIPSATIERVAARLEKHGHIPRGYLGLGFQLVAIEGGKRGVMVMNVEPQGPGANAGVHQGDIIVAWNNEPIRQIRSALARARAGQRRPDGYAWTTSRRRDKERCTDDRRETRYLSNSIEAAPIRLALNIEDRALADQLAKLLANVPGLRLVGANESAEVALVLSNGASKPAGDDIVLTPRELEVLTLLAEGLSNKAIARRLGISVHTAKFHVSALMDKFDAVGRTDAVAHAVRRGVIHL